MADVTIVDFAQALHAARPQDIDLPTPRWMATLKVIEGLPLTDDDVSLVAAVSHRSPAAIRSYCGHEIQELWARIGRRGRKSATIAMYSDYKALYGGYEQYLMFGEIALGITISKDLAGAELIRRFQRVYLDALGIRYQDTKFGAVAVTLIEGSRIALACLPCSSEAPRGLPVPFAIFDEPAFWMMEGYADPDVQIAAATRPAMLQFPNRKLLAISSPFTCQGLFHTTVENALGKDDERRILAVTGPTWDWAPETEAETRALEPDEDTHRREYGAVPDPIGSTMAFAPAAADGCFGRQIPDEANTYEPIGVLDMSSGGGDSLTAGVCQVVVPTVDVDALCGGVGLAFEGRKPVFEQGVFIRMQRVFSRVDPKTHQLVEFQIPRLKPLIAFREILIIKGGFWGEIDGEQLAVSRGAGQEGQCIEMPEQIGNKKSAEQRNEADGRPFEGYP